MTALHDIAIASLLLGLGRAAIIALRESANPHQTWIMRFVWPLTALLGTFFWL